MICSYDHALAKFETVAPSQLQGESFIFLSKSYGKAFYKDLMKAFRQDGTIIGDRKEVASFDELLFAVSIGEGIGIAAEDVVRKNDVKVLPLVNSHHHSRYVIAYHKDEASPLLLDFISAVKRHFITSAK